MNQEQKITQCPDEVVRQLLWFGALLMEQTHAAAARAYSSRRQQVGLGAITVLFSVALADSWLGLLPVAFAWIGLALAARNLAPSEEPSPTEPEWFHATLTDPARLRQAHLEALLRCYQTRAVTPSAPADYWILAAAAGAALLRAIGIFVR